MVTDSARIHNQELDSRGEIYGYWEEHISFKRLNAMTDEELQRVCLRRHRKGDPKFRGRYTYDAIHAQQVQMLRRNPFAEITIHALDILH